MVLTTMDPKPALVVIDLQKGIVSSLPGPSTDQVVRNATDLANAFRRQDLPVALVNVAGGPPGRTDRSGPAAVVRSPDWLDLIDQLEAQPDDHLVTKQRRSAFHDTGLDAWLRDRGVTQVVLVGISTSSGVESSARSASDSGYHVVMVTDAMTDPDAAAHDHSVERIFPKLGETTSARELLDMMENRT